MTRYFAAIFSSASMTDGDFSKLKSSCADALCLRIGHEISAEAADFFCDGAFVTRSNLMTSKTTGGTYIHAPTVTRIQASEAAFASLDPDQILMFTHEGDQNEHA